MSEKHLKKQYWINTLETGYIYINDGENHMSWQGVVDTLNSLKEENEQLASELVECKALIMMLSDTTVSGRVDNIIYSRYNFYSEDEYYEKLDEYKNKVIKELGE